MTSFSHLSRDFDWGSATWEIRSVNQRYLECQFKLPEQWRSLEAELRTLIGGAVKRGKIECTLHVTPKDQLAADLRIDTRRVTSLLNAVGQLRSIDPDIAPPDPLQLLQWPGVIEQSAHNPADTQAGLMTLFGEAVTALTDNRQREGTAIAGLLTGKVATARDIISAIRADFPKLLKLQHERMLQRLQDLAANLSDERSHAEIALLAQKADIAEELDRLQTHCDEVEHILSEGGICGRKLDFLMQELNREANTLSSKSVGASTTAAAVELKVLIEQMREQIQNLE